MWVNKQGFTLVELLIVIVVIAILAAITIVAFGGIQNRANNTSVQADLRNTFSSIKQYEIVNGSYPTGNSQINATFTTSRGAYGGGANFLLYCQSSTDAAIIGRSKSGTGFTHGSISGATTITTWPGDGNSQLCPLAGIPTTAPGYTATWIGVNNGWQSWYTVGA